MGLLQDWKRIVGYTAILCVLSVVQLVSTNICTAFVGKQLGTKAQAAWAITSAPQLLLGYALWIAMGGTTARIGTAVSEGDYVQAGKRINLSIQLTLVYSVIASTLLYVGKPLIYLMYNAQPDVREIATPLLIFRVFILPFSTLGLTLCAILQGMKKVHIMALIAGLASVCESSGVGFILYVFKSNDLWTAAAGTMLGAILECACGLIYIYRPRNAVRYQLFTRNTCYAIKSSKELFSSYANDTGFLMVRGVLMLAIFLGGPLLSGHVGNTSDEHTTSTTAYSILWNLLIYSAYLSENLGSVCNILGSHYLGERKFDDMKRLMLIMPLIGLFGIGVPTLAILYGLQMPLMHFFTSDDKVEALLKEAWPLLLVLQPFASSMGVYEGLLLCHKFFRGLCISMIVNISVYLPILMVNLFVWNSFRVLFGAVVIFYAVRLLPYPLMLHWWARKEMIKTQQTLVGDALEVDPLLKSAPPNYSIQNEPITVNGEENIIPFV